MLDKFGKDTLFNCRNIESGSFVFDKQVATVFNDMINRSVPFFEHIQQMIVDFSMKFVLENSVLYDFGCSTGTTLFKVLSNLNVKCTAYGLDNSVDMLNVAKQDVVRFNFDSKLFFELVDLNEPYSFESSSFGIFNLVLQFLPLSVRASLLSSFYDALLPGGAIVLIEKVHCDNSQLDQHYIDMFYRYKQENNYSKQEIAMKEKALSGVLNPLTVQDNIMMLKDVGFNTIESFFQWYNFIGIIAIKSQ